VVGEEDLAVTVRAIIDTNLYMVLGTADERGQPWVTPVYYAATDYREFFWVSRPEAVHSRNIKARPAIGIVIFDSSVPIGTGQGVYMNAIAEKLQADDHAPGIEVFSRRSLQHGGAEWTSDDVQPPAELRLYRATARTHYVLGPRDERIEVRF
jgi:nitroimidazol reductase NimA-like FMN-containing flavoprotein (pyridoxamine 5'-phosphate oxidase superfamily)